MSATGGGLPQLPESVDGGGPLRSTLLAIVELGIRGKGPLKGAVHVAEEHRASSASDEAAVQRFIRTHQRLATGNGFITGLGGLATLPVTLPAGVGGLYLLSSRMCAGIAHLRGYDVESEEVRSAIGVCLIGTAGAEAAGKVGAEATKRFLTASLRRMPATRLVAINQRVGFRLVTKFGSTGVVNLGKAIPLVGGPVNAAVDTSMCRAVARYADKTFAQIETADGHQHLVIGEGT